MHSYQNLEARIKEIGAEIDSSLRGEIPSFFDQRRWKGKMMEWSMRDEVFKIQLFRFVDVLPSLTKDELVVKLLREYFTEEVNAPPIIRKGIMALGKRGPLPAVAGRLIRKNVEALALPERIRKMRSRRSPD